MIIKITNCQECPFVNNDNEYGFNECHISEKVNKTRRGHDQLPEDNVHDLCPLKTEPIIVKI